MNLTLDKVGTVDGFDGWIEQLCSLFKAKSVAVLVFHPAFTFACSWSGISKASIPSEASRGDVPTTCRFVNSLVSS
jgi:histidinol-phosphate/aromatic aminotransferase/cobyric acid decarboxylase-like protein